MRSEVDSIQTIRVVLMKESQENVIHVPILNKNVLRLKV